MATLAANGGLGIRHCDKPVVAATGESSGGEGATRPPRRISCPHVNQTSLCPLDCPRCKISYEGLKPGLWIHPAHKLMIIRS